MKLNFTKTIFIIVFVVFLGIVKINDVNADAMSCYYESDEVKALIIVPADYGKSYTAQIGFASNNFYFSVNKEFVLNWYEGDVKTLKKNGVNYSSYTTYNAYDDVHKNENCPPYLVYAKSSGSEIILMSDSANVSRVAQYAEESYNAARFIKLKQLSIMSLVSTTSTNPGNTAQVTPKSCVCNDTTSPGYRVHSSFNIAEKLSLLSPSVKLLLNQDSYNTRILNWDSSTYTPSTSYTGINGVTTNNSCPEYLLVGDAWRKYLFVSDSANLAKIKSDITKYFGISTDYIYTVSCSEDFDSDATISGSDQSSPKPEYKNPSVNTGSVLPFERSQDTYTCGDLYIIDIPATIPRITSLIYTFLQIIVPVALVILGMIDLMKAITSQKEDEIKKGQQTFIKRLIAAAIIFFVFAIVKLVLGIFSNSSSSIIDCMNCFLDGVEHCE